MIIAAKELLAEIAMVCVGLVPLAIAIVNSRFGISISIIAAAIIIAKAGV